MKKLTGNVFYFSLMGKTPLIFKCLIFSFILIFVHQPLSAQDEQYIFRDFTYKDGISGGFISDLLVDRNGFIWIARDAGIMRFDGTNSLVFKHNSDNKNSIIPGAINSILESKNGYIWAAGENGISKYNPKTNIFQRVATADSIRIENIIESNNRFWAATSKGLYEVENYNSDPFAPTFVLKDQLGLSISNLVVLDDNTLSFSTDNEVYLYAISQNETSKLNLPQVTNNLDSSSVDIRRMVVDQDHEMWIETNYALLKRAANGHIEEINSLGNMKENISHFNLTYADNLGNIILDRHGKIYKYDKKKNEINPFNYKEDQIFSQDIHVIKMDRNNNYVIAFHNTFSYMYPKQWKNDLLIVDSTKSTDSLINYIANFVIDNKGNNWFSTSDGLVFKSKEGKLTNYGFPINEDFIGPISLYHDKIMVLNFEKIYVFDINKKEFSKINLPIPMDLNLEYIENKRFWIFGDNEKGLLKLNKETLEITYFPNPYNDPKNTEKIGMSVLKDIEETTIVHALFGDENANNISWKSYIFNDTTDIFTPTGLKSPEQLKYLDKRIPFNIISHSDPGVTYSIHHFGILKEDIYNKKQDILYADQITDWSFDQFTPIYEWNHQLIIHSNDQVYKLSTDKEEIQNFEGDPEQAGIIYFLPKFISNDFIYIRSGNVNKNLYYDLNQEFKPSSPPNLQIFSIGSGNQNFDLLNYSNLPIIFNDYNNNIIVEFGNINFTNSRSRFRYKLTGVKNDQWVNLDNQSTINLFNLAPGKYNLKIESVLGNNNFTDNFKEITFEILPPWYKTNIAYFGMILMFLIFGYTGIKIKEKQTISREREKTREKELAQAKEIEKAYSTLKSTQSQLIQAEKMASLGELTAGIAHEIQNPLNFVNNFSEVSNELLDEMIQELDKGEIDEARTISNDVKLNLEKILHHGKRADGIVKGMLQHSRTSTGQKESTDINVLCDEYLRLSYHGLRARDKSFNAKFISEFEPSVGSLDVIPQDLGRVLLNLINNAFYAVNERKQSTTENYQPTVTVKTKKEDKHIIILISDNGKGISEEIKEKIFQPFFTTKPTGKGTGLGLSLSYDIIKMHGGIIDLKSTIDEGTEFTIKLPIL